jgi:hypothetical protein
MIINDGFNCKNIVQQIFYLSSWVTSGVQVSEPLIIIERVNYFLVQVD